MIEKSLNGEVVAVVAADAVRVKSPLTTVRSSERFALGTSGPSSAGADSTYRPLATPHVPPATGSKSGADVAKSSLTSRGPVAAAAPIGVTACDTAESGPHPALLRAFTVKRYAMPLLS